jgi:RimJ/RimL family protein N-acetyltransferase
MPMDRFDTERLSAERLHQGHLQDLVTLHLDPDVSRYLGGVRSAEATENYLAVNIAHWDRHGFGLWVLRTKSGEFAGRAGIRHVVVEDTSEIEIAYTFRRTLWGQGLACEIAGALTTIARSQLQLPSLVGLVALANGASRRVLEKTGFSLERHARFHREEVALYRSQRFLP